MSGNEAEIEEKPFAIEIAKQGRANCKKCKQKCDSGALRIAKLTHNPFGGSGKLKQWHHIDCLLEIFLNQRPTTKRIDDLEEIDGFDNLDEENQNAFIGKWEECERRLKDKYGDKLPPRKVPQKKTTPKKNYSDSKPGTSTETDDYKVDVNHKDRSFREFRIIVAEITNESSYLEKTAIIKKLFTKGSDGQGFKGDIIQWCRLLLPGILKRVYNLQSKQLIKLFSRIFETDQEDMLEDLEQGDIGETIQKFFEESQKIPPIRKSVLTLQQVDDFLEELSTLTKEDEQMHHFKMIVRKSTSNDLKIIIRLIKHDLRMNAGAKHILDAVHPKAYEAFQSSRDLTSVLRRILRSTSNTTSTLRVTITLMTPVLPMLAEACKSIEMAMKKCPNGMYSEIKYDGERVQLHKKGNDIKYFSRSLKPVMAHKVAHFKDYIPIAFPHGKDLILDSEVLMLDTTNGKPLPFGSLGVHKKEEFKNASVCLFVFDCIYFNGEVLTHKPMKERRRILLENMTEIQNHIMFSQVSEVHKASDLAEMIATVFNLGLEGLVLKDLNSMYEPGKRHWLKVKKDYLCDGAMADSADLIVLGAWFGTGKKGGMMSVFLMGVYDESGDKFRTVTKVHTGHDDKTLERLQNELDMVKISCDATKVPNWLKCTKSMIPDFVAKDPRQQPVWEITGAEFTQHDVHTADGISIRFPRVTKIRDDKDWKSATTLEELRKLFKNSNVNTDYHELLMKDTLMDLDVKKEENKKNNKVSQKQRSVKDLFTNADDKTTIKKDPDEIKEEYKTDLMKLNKEINDDVPVPIKRRRVADSMKEKYAEHLQNMSNVLDSDDDESKTVNKRRSSTDSDDGLERKKIKIKCENDLYPIVFTNIKAYFLDVVQEEYNDIVRHFLAVGGEVVRRNEINTATHVIHNENEFSDRYKNDFPSSVRHVVVDWIKDSIGNGTVQDTRPYSVTLIPDN